jgi:hypothetical protein
MSSILLPVPLSPDARAGDYAVEFHVHDSDRARLLFDQAVQFWHDGRHVSAAMIARGALEAGLQSLFLQTYPAGDRRRGIPVLIRSLRKAEVFRRPTANNVGHAWKIGSAVAHGVPCTYAALARMMRCTGLVVRLAEVKGGAV